MRRHIDKLGYDNSFTIYDSDDQKSLIRGICKQFKVDTKSLPERAVMNAISSAKDEFMTPGEYETRYNFDFKKKKIAEIYKEYQKQLKANNALDFDDLLFKTVELFQFHPEVLDYYQEASAILWWMSTRIQIPSSFSSSACWRGSIRISAL